MPKPISLLVLALPPLLAFTPAAAHARRDPADIPPPVGAHPGQCFAKVREPAEVTHTRDQILVKPAGAFERTIPAVTRQVERRVLVTPATTDERRHPAVYRTVWRVVTEPGPTTVVSVPARYRTVTERVLISPARTVWKEGAGRPVTGEARPGAQTLVATGEVLCRVRIPARYAVHIRRVLVSPPGERTVAGRPVSHQVSQSVLLSPERVERIAHPAVYRTERETVVVAPARTVFVRTPPQWRVVEHTRSVARYGWRPVVCVHRAPVYAAPQEATPYGERG